MQIEVLKFNSKRKYTDGYNSIFLLKKNFIVKNPKQKIYKYKTDTWHDIFTSKPYQIEASPRYEPE